jgi:hypothetical protein
LNIRGKESGQVFSGKGDGGGDTARNAEGEGDIDGGEVADAESVLEGIASLKADVAEFDDIISGHGASDGQAAIAEESDGIVAEFNLFACGIEKSQDRIEGRTEAACPDFDRQFLSSGGGELVVVASQTIDLAIHGTGDGDYLGVFGFVVGLGLRDGLEVIDEHKIKIGDTAASDGTESMQSRGGIGRDVQIVGDFGGVGVVVGDVGCENGLGGEAGPNLRRIDEVASGEFQGGGLTGENCPRGNRPD